MTKAFSLRAELLRHAKSVVSPVLGMSVILGLFNAETWSFAATLPKVQTWLGMGLLGCTLGLVALFIGLFTSLATQKMMDGRPGCRIHQHRRHALFYSNPVTS